jgi:hypothetical protein
LKHEKSAKTGKERQVRPADEVGRGLKQVVGADSKNTWRPTADERPAAVLQSQTGGHYEKKRSKEKTQLFTGCAG